MSLHLQLPQVRDTASGQPHPVVHMTAVALLIWFVTAAWLLFGGSGYIDLVLAMITVLAFMVVAIPMALWRAKVQSQHSSSIASNENRAAGEKQPLGMWLRSELITHSGREKSSAATVEMLLPIAAVAFGITALGIVFDLVRAGAM